MLASSQAVQVAGPRHHQFQVALLGTPGTSWLGQPLPLARRQARALLFRVAAATQPVPRDQLCFLLWPDQPDAVARRNLSVLLDQLRRALPAPDVLLKTGDAVALNPQRAWADTAAFEQHASAAMRDGQLERLASTTQLYRGPFLDGFALPGSAEFDDWAGAERQQWERRFLETLSTLVEAHTARGEHGAAVEAAQRYLAVDALAEDMHRRSIALYAAMGERGAALRQFERCVVALERELGVDPLPETRAVYEAVRDGLDPFTGTPATVQPSVLRMISTAQPTPPASVRSLPVPVSPMLGRHDELAAARAQLRNRARLLTLCGPGGSGKTRLALAVAADVREQYADGVVWVPLAPLRDPQLVAEAISQACGLQRIGDADPADALQAHLRDKQVLLIVDNVEHLLPAANGRPGREVVPGLFADLLAAAPRLQLLTTSRSVLNIYGEHVLPVLPLPLPDPEQLPLDELAQQPAVALLLARARAHNEAVRISHDNAAELAAICVQLDGLPLAIELAAARLRLLSPRELLRRLDHRLALLEGGPRDLPERQQTLRATIAWSYQLLDAAEARLLDHLAVFAGGWTQEAIENVALRIENCELRIEKEAVDSVNNSPRSEKDYFLNSQFSILNSLQVLQDAHLVVRQDGADGEPRFMMLETIREYALEQLQQRGLVDSTARAHALYFLKQAEQTEPELGGPRQAQLLALLDAEHANFKVALETFYASGEVERGLRLAAALERFWRARGYLHEGQWWIERLLERRHTGAAGVPDGVVARAHGTACTLAFYRADHQAARAHAEAGSALLRACGSRRELALLLIKLIRSCDGASDVAAHAASEAQALARELADPEVDAELGRTFADQAIRLGDMAQARAYYEGSLQFWQARGDTLRQIADLYTLANLCLTLDDVGNAERHGRQMLELAGALASRSGRALALYTLGEITRYMRDLPRAERFYGECLHLFTTSGMRNQAAYAAHNLGCVLLDGGQYAEARSLILRCLQYLKEQHRSDLFSETLDALGRIAAAQGRPLQAARLWGAAEAQLEQHTFLRLPIDQREHERYQALARAASVPAEFEAAWRAGRRLSAEYALAEEASGSMPALRASAA